jgi:uncharacterized protein (DUF433 family)
VASVKRSLTSCPCSFCACAVRHGRRHQAPAQLKCSENRVNSTGTRANGSSARSTSYPRTVKEPASDGNRMTYTRITTDPPQMGGQPCIRGLRIPVATVVAMVADGMASDEIVEAYPDLEPEDVTEALHYAAEALRERELPLRVTA